MPLNLPFEAFVFAQKKILAFLHLANKSYLRGNTNIPHYL
jgi:hypothetical protein